MRKSAHQGDQLKTTIAAKALGRKQVYFYLKEAFCPKYQKNFLAVGFPTAYPTASIGTGNRGAKMRKYVTGLANKYKNWKIRLIITMIIVVIIALIWHFGFSPQQGKYSELQNLWLLGAYFVSFFITGILFFSVHFNTYQNTSINDKVKDALAVGVIFLLVDLAALLVAFLCFHSNSPLLFIIPIVFAGTVFWLDHLLSKAEIPGLANEKWRYFDVAVLTGVSAVAILQWAMVTIDGVPEQVVNGFGGGATAFQLIMANIVFDPEAYLKK